MLLSLPNELLYLIGKDSNLSLSDLSSFCQTNRHIKTLLTPLLIHRGGKDSVLVFASQRGFVSQVQDALALGANVEAVDWEYDCPPLQWAARGGHELTVKLLLQHGAKVGKVGNYGRTALHWAAVADDRYGEALPDLSHKLRVPRSIHAAFPVRVSSYTSRAAYGIGGMSVRRVFNSNDDEGSDEEGSDEEGSNSDQEPGIGDKRQNFPRPPRRIQGAAYEAVVQLLLDNGAGINCKDHRNETALHLAVQSGKVEIVKLLLVDEGLDVKMAVKEGRTSLHYAKCPRMMTFLLEQGADFDAKDSSGQTPLHIMARLQVSPEVIACINLLVSKGADVEAQDIHNRTPLHRAVISSTLEIVKLFIQHKAYIAPRDNNGLTPLHWATISRRLDIIRLLIDSGADITVRSHNDRTLLHEIIHLSRVDMSSCFNEESIWFKGGGGRRFYRYDPWDGEPNRLERATWEEIVKLLLDLGLNAYAVDKTGYPPYKAARAQDWRRMSDIITKYRPPKVLPRNRSTTDFDIREWYRSNSDQ